MNIGKLRIINFGNNINYFINLYKRKIMSLKIFITMTNITFPTVTLLLIIISTFNIAGGQYETQIAGSDYIILSAMISGIIALINSLISFFLLKEKLNYYNGIYYKLIIEKQKYELNGGKYCDLEDIEDKEKVFENELFLIITGYTKESEKQK